MVKYDVYKDIAGRTKGDIYVGIVGAVRTGKSTFAAKVTEKLILPNISGKLAKKIATDEMPQSAEGKTVMTTQPKFIPAEAVKVNLGEKSSVNMRLIDCVGYIVDGATGHTENGEPRMVKTPWSDKDMPFEKAAEIGTEKVIKEHSTVCVLVTTDGSFTGISRENYSAQEARVVAELKEAGKPFCILLNVADTSSKETALLREKMSKLYSVPVIVKDCTKLELGDITEVFEQILLDFGVNRIDVDMPDWVRTLSYDSPLITEITDGLKKASSNVFKMRDFTELASATENSERMSATEVGELRLGEGVIRLQAEPKKGVFYNILSEECGEEIPDEYHLMSYVKSLSVAKREYAKTKDATDAALTSGYGVVLPPVDDITLGKPEVVKEKGMYGLKLNASAHSLFMLNVGVNASVTPFVGSKEQCDEMLTYLENEKEKDPSEVFKTNMFGKSLSDVVYEGVKNKLTNMSGETSAKLLKTVTKIVNEGNGGVICILL